MKPLIAFGISLLLITTALAAMRDPTRPYNYQGPTEAANAAYTLTSILTSPGRQVAIINGKVVQVGATIGDAKVIRIERQAVWLERDGKKFSIQLPSLSGVTK